MEIDFRDVSDVISDCGCVYSKSHLDTPCPFYPLCWLKDDSDS
jgi:hypothetical protein